MHEFSCAVTNGVLLRYDLLHPTRISAKMVWDAWTSVPNIFYGSSLIGSEEPSCPIGLYTDARNYPVPIGSHSKRNGYSERTPVPVNWAFTDGADDPRIAVINVVRYATMSSAFQLRSIADARRLIDPSKGLAGALRPPQM